MNDNRQEMLNKISDLDKKMDTILSLLTSKNNELNNFEELKPIIDQELKQVRQLSSVPEKQSQHLLYPDSNIYKSFVPLNKKPWDIDYENYSPPQYTSKDVLFSLVADPELINRSESLRPYINFNTFDQSSGIDRRSCLGEYTVKNSIPINPKGRQGLSGRGSLLYWGPNHVLEVILTRYRKDERGELVYDNNGRRVIEFVAVENEQNWTFPSVINLLIFSVIY